MSEKEKLVEGISFFIGQALAIQNPHLSEDELKKSMERGEVFSKMITDRIAPLIVDPTDEEKDQAQEKKLNSLGWYKPNDPDLPVDEFNRKMVAVVFADDTGSPVIPAVYMNGQIEVLAGVDMSHKVKWMCLLPEHPFWNL